MKVSGSHCLVVVTLAQSDSRAHCEGRLCKDEKTSALSFWPSDADIDFKKDYANIKSCQQYFFIGFRCLIGSLNDEIVQSCYLVAYERLKGKLFTLTSVSC